MSCLAITMEDFSLFWCSDAEKKKLFRESKSLNVKRRRGRVFDCVRNESFKSLLLMIDNQSFDTDLNRARDFAGSLESIWKIIVVVEFLV